MKRVIFSLAIVAFAFGATAQTTPKMSVAVNLGAPTTSGYKIAYGADAQADFLATEGLFITGSAGYQNYHWKSGSVSGNNGFIPLLAGAKFTFGQSKAYGHAQLGYGISTSKGGNGAFAYAPSVGYLLNEHFDGSIKYLAMSRNGSTLGSLNLRVAYNF